MSRTQHTNFSADERSPWLTTRFKPLVTSLIAVDVLLVVVAIVVAVNVFGQGETPPPSPTAQPSQSAPSDPVEQTSDDASAATEDLEVSGARKFASPSGNISCIISAVGAECGIAALNNPPSEGAGQCEGFVGYVVQLNASGVVVPCVERADLPGSANPNAEFLDYGDKIDINNFTCVSERSGMKCTDVNTGSGFSIARAGISQF